MAFGIAIPSPPKLLSVEEVPKPGSGVQAIPDSEEQPLAARHEEAAETPLFLAAAGTQEQHEGEE